MTALTTLVRWIAVVTAVTGGAQIVAAGPILGVIGGEPSPIAMHLFATVGMFMVIVGGILYAALGQPESSRSAIGWAAAQKFGASVAVGIGVAHHVFSALALAVASFDFVSAIAVAALWWRTSPGTAAPAAAE